MREREAFPIPRSAGRSLPLLFALALALPTFAGAADPLGTPAAVPEVLEGFTLTTLTAAPAATAITFGPGDGDGDDLYATTLTGSVLRYALTWGAAGPLVTGVSTFASGFSQPLGLVFDGDVLYVADSTSGAESGRLDGRVTRVEAGAHTEVVSGIPNGRHNTNNLRMGPDGRLYIANGNPNDSGPASGDADVFPYSGAILAVEPDIVGASPAILHWRASGGAALAPSEIASHPRNADFAAKVDVIGFGFRNVYDVAFSPSGAVYTATNGADEPASQDLLYKITPGADHGFPFCYNEGPAGGVGDDVAVVANPIFGDDARCADVPRATALLGWHVCATGLDFPTSGPAGFSGAWADSVYVAECGPFFQDVVTRMQDDPARASHDTGHKIARVGLDAEGEATIVHDFVTGLALPTDVLFGPDGAMYIGDIQAIHRVAPVALPSPTLAPADAAGTPVLAAPGAWVSNYATPAAAVAVGGTLTLVNADLMRHNVVARVDFGADDAPWCGSYGPARCPLFWSELIGTGATTEVLGLDALEAGRTYEFFCTIHPSMRGTLAALPGAS